MTTREAYHIWLVVSGLILMVGEGYALVSQVFGAQLSLPNGCPQWDAPAAGVRPHH